MAGLEDGLGDAKGFLKSNDGYKEREGMGERSGMDGNVENHGDAER